MKPQKVPSVESVSCRHVHLASAETPHHTPFFQPIPLSPSPFSPYPLSTHTPYSPLKTHTRSLSLSILRF
ncbi:hypothetical protein L1987_29390 [Smallanthus sonchifolius]|uniref:Uncharacterized protein n=1 Tax=Smallanthus sonchifolius TaxID=185202 RepID=A0ACB9I141_9ASTR|nr:hypothetical protein L1987_29390 [Smallanthus sonchifolius]